MLLDDRVIAYWNNDAEMDLIDLIETQYEPVLLGWLQHFGCMLCRKQTADWRAMRRKLEERGCNSVCMILVDNGYSN